HADLIWEGVLSSYLRSISQNTFLSLTVKHICGSGLVSEYENLAEESGGIWQIDIWCYQRGQATS
ncbi:hypothetical protein LOAG_01609, partial [Loa loa]